MKHGFPLFIGEVISFEIPDRRYASISKSINDKPETDSGYKMERKASKSLDSTSPSDMMVGRGSWSRMSSRANRVEKYVESREKKYRWTQYSTLST